MRSLASAMAGDDDRAIDDAAAVWAEPGSTYLDRVLADVSAGAAFVAEGDDDRARERLQQAADTAISAGDAPVPAGPASVKIP